MKLPSRFFFSLCLVSMFSMTLLFADNSISSASMTVEAYKEIPKPDGIFNIQVSFLNESGSKTSVSGIGNTFDISSRDVQGSSSLRCGPTTATKLSFRSDSVLLLTKSTKARLFPLPI